MRATLSAAGRSFLRAFGASLLVLAPGILAAPNLDQSKLLGVAALLSSIAAGIRAVQVFVPQLSFSELLPDEYAGLGDYLDSFARAFIGTFLVLLLGILDAPNFDAGKALLSGLLVGALAAGLLAVQKLWTDGEDPAPAVGISKYEKNV